jgi:hypothetical protein
VQARQAFLQNKPVPQHHKRSAVQQLNVAIAGAGDFGANLQGVSLIHGEGNVFKGAGVTLKPDLNSYMELVQVWGVMHRAAVRWGRGEGGGGMRWQLWLLLMWCDVFVQSGVSADVTGKKQPNADTTDAVAAAASAHDGVMEECEGQLVKNGAAAGFDVM